MIAGLTVTSSSTSVFYYSLELSLSMASTHHGSCLCSAIKYEITGDPFTYLVCHCINCKKATGAAFMANAFFRTDVRKIFTFK